jgi:signal transduction histidine kinase
MTEAHLAGAPRQPTLADQTPADQAPADQAPATPAPFTYTARVWTIALGLTLVFNTLVAIVLYTFRLTPGGLFENLVYSHCIGLLICTGILLPRTLFWRQRRPRPIVMAALAVLGAAFGLFAGRALAAWLCGLPVLWGIGVSQERSSFVTSLIISVFATFASIVYFWTREREAVFSLHTAQAREKAEIVSRQLTETQLRLLRAQIDPHMLFNTLSNLRALIAQDPPAAQKMLDRLIDFFRVSLQASRSEWSSCQREFDLASDYLALIAIRMGPRLSYQLTLPAELENTAMPSMLLQPLVENAIKHGIEPAMDGGSIAISVSQIDNQLELRIENTGVSLDPKRHSSDGYGNQHLRERLSNLYGERARFELSELPGGGTLARVVLPVEMSH